MPVQNWRPHLQTWNHDHHQLPDLVSSQAVLSSSHTTPTLSAMLENGSWSQLGQVLENESILKTEGFLTSVKQCGVEHVFMSHPGLFDSTLAMDSALVSFEKFPSLFSAIVASVLLKHTLTFICLSP